MGRHTGTTKRVMGPNSCTWASIWVLHQCFQTWLITKDSYHSAATATFADTEVKVTSQGRPHLGAGIGTQEHIDHYVQEKAQQWSQELKCLASIAKTQPHAAFAAFTHGIISKWRYIASTIPIIAHHLQSLEDVIRSELLPALMGRSPPNDIEHDLLALPDRLGGISLVNPTSLPDQEFSASLHITEALKELILQHNSDCTYDIMAEQINPKIKVHKQKRQQTTINATQLKSKLPNTLFKSHGSGKGEGSLQLANLTTHRRVWIHSPQRSFS